MTNFEKAKRLRETRRMLGLTLKDMAAHLELDPTYLSQLENARREVDEHYVKKAAQIGGMFEESKKVKPSLQEEPSGFGPIRERCHEYLDKLLDAYEGDEDLLRWFMVEFTRRFQVPTLPQEPSSDPAVKNAADALGQLVVKQALKNKPKAHQ